MGAFLSEVIVRKSDIGRSSWPESPDGLLSWLGVIQEILARKHLLRDNAVKSGGGPHHQGLLSTCPVEGDVESIDQDLSDSEIVELLLTNARKDRSTRFPPVSYTHLTLPTNREV